MSYDFQEDSFGDDFEDEELIAEVDRRKELNRHVNSIEHRTLRQLNLDGEFVSNLDQDGNEITYKRIENIISFKPSHHSFNELELSTYVYPTNFEVRDYQFDIVSKALFKNVLCALPTGLGKTFIASTVMLNFYLWTKTAKIIFMAPTRPLVAQQIKACYGVTGIPSHDTAILLDKTKKNRAEIWETKRVFFATPQVVENDLKSGFVNPKDIVCLVIDEAHRAKGNYAYNNVVKFMNRFSNSFRILALTATPASDIDGVQELIDNLSISKVELRAEDSIDTAKYMKKKKIERITCPPSDCLMDIIDLLAAAAAPTLEKCVKFKIYEVNDPYKINAFVAMELSQKIVRDPSISEGLKWMYYFLLQILAVVGQGFRRLNIYGVRNFYTYFEEKYTEFAAKWETKKSTNKYALDFYYHPNVKRLLKICKETIEKDDSLSLVGQGTSGLFSHTKFERMVEQLADFFELSGNPDSRVIIFTEFRDSALEIVKVIDTYNTNHRDKLPTELKPHVFIGQSKEKSKFDDVEFRRKAAPKRKGRKTAKQQAKELEEKKLQEEEAKMKKLESRQKKNASRVGSSELAQETGMSQQQQKEVIEKFKTGFYNIIVATSIGEEGLDIGEVDMIICFDSTSSPIKNIQRMGRTGRKRDGKVLLLFSSNEEMKFDSAMGGYNYVQKQIQSGQNLKYLKSDRIVPKEFDPVVEKRFIEIPDENTELISVAKQESDEEFLKLATQVTLGRKKLKSTRKPASSSSKKDEKPKKNIKKFFMPDNVETGFKSASSLVEKYSNGSLVPQKRSQVTCSESDREYLKVSDIKKQKKSTGTPDTTLESIFELEDDGEDELELLIKKEDLQNIIMEDDIDDNDDNGVKDDNEDIDNHVEKGRLEKQSSPLRLKHNSIQPSQRKRTLGSTRRGTMNVIESLKRQAKERPYKPIIVNKDSEPIIVVDEESTPSPPASISKRTHKAIPSVDNKPNSTALDDPQPTPFQQPNKSIIEQIESFQKDKIIDPSTFSAADGYLTPEELEQFYTKYHTPAVRIDDRFFEPKPIKNELCTIGHSTKMHRFLEFMYSTKK